ncbi:MAG: hypothetical protein ACI85N_001318 [Gammaproteobacteria bacterium]|jgi:hypothetical protein
MYSTCPKCKHERQEDDTANPDTCPACGIIFSKWMKQQFSSPESKRTTRNNIETSDSPGIIKIISSSLFFVEDKVNPFIFYGRALVFIGIAVWGWQFINMDFINNPTEIGSSFLHRINLVFHEAGHVVFMPFGWFMTKLGGTLGQLLMPAVVMLTFLIKNKNNFGASVGLWWLGQSFMECAPYVDDAYNQQLVLLGGVTGADKPGYHDWNAMLIDIGKLESHREIANTFNTTGILLILLALAWGAYLLYKQFKNIDSI